MWPHKKKKKTALVLSGGSARGLAHIGIIKVLKREGIKFDLVVGTSIGALVGAIYSLDTSIEETEKLALKTSTSDILDITISRMGIAEGNRLENIIGQLTCNKTFEDTKIPFVAVAVDVGSGEEVCLSSGNLVKAIRASCSLPGIYKPVDINGRTLIDGGMRLHLPVKVAKSLGADFVVAVDVGFCIKKGRVNNMLGVIMQAIQIMGEELSYSQSEKVDILIKPRIGADVDQMAFNKAAYIIQKGAEAAEEALPLLKNM